MRRARSIVLSAASLALLAATCALWSRSGQRSDYAGKTTPTRVYVAMTFPGGVKFTTWGSPQEKPGPVQLASYEYDVRNAYGAWMSRPAVSWAKGGFDLQEVRFSNRPGPEPNAFEAYVPFWFLAAAFLLLPAGAAVAAVRRWLRRGARRCPTCGYDLRASPGRCPECGTPAAARAVAEPEASR